MNNAPIGVFDSGLGGLTAVKELVRLAPFEDIIYFGDTARVPYGGRSKETLIKYAMEDIEVLKRHGVKMIIAACGTVSSTLPLEISENIGVPYLGVVQSAVDKAVSSTKLNKIGVIGTQATIKSDSYPKLIQKALPHAQVFKNPCPLFVPLVENGYTNIHNEVTKLVAKEYLTPIKNEGVDTLIMGCTHYPVIRHIIADFMGDNVTLIDPGAQAAKSAMKFLKENNMLTDKKTTGKRTFLVSDTTDSFYENAKNFLGHGDYKDVRHIDIGELTQI